MMDKLQEKMFPIYILALLPAFKILYLYEIY